MKKTKMRLCVCLSQRSKFKGHENINGQSDVFAIQLSSNQVSSGWEFDRSGFEGLGVRPIRFRRAGNSANQVISVSPLVQSSFEALEVQPIRFSGGGSSTNQLSRRWGFDQSGFEGLGVQPIRF